MTVDLEPAKGYFQERSNNEELLHRDRTRAAAIAQALEQGQTDPASAELQRIIRSNRRSLAGPVMRFIAPTPFVVDYIVETGAIIDTRPAINALAGIDPEKAVKLRKPFDRAAKRWGLRPL